MIGEETMSGSKILKQAMLEENVKPGQLADMLGISGGTMSMKLYRDAWTIAKLEEALDALGYKLIAVKKGEDE